MGHTHLAITVELVHGSHTGDLWPRPGRVLIASRSATFEQLATAIDDAFARWDRTVITPHRWWDGEEPDGSLGLVDLPPILPWWGPQPSRGRQASLPSGEVTEIRYRDLIT